LGQWLRENGLTPDHVVSSPAERAKQTTLKVCKEIGIDKKTIRWDPRIYDADVAGLIQALADCPATVHNVLLVGHNPGLESLVDYLCGDDTPLPEDGKLLPTATVARLQIPEAWDNLHPGVATLVSITRPASLT
jgi:phosphohistidine phosphatase